MQIRTYFILLTLALGLFACSPPRYVDKPSIPLRSFSFSQVDSLRSIEQRPVAIFLHAEWCKYCKNMEYTTLRNEKVVQLLNDKFYFVPFDGEYRKDIEFRGNTFAFQPNGRRSGTHELARALGTIDGELIYPTLVILNPQDEIVFQYGAYLGTRQMKSILSKAAN